MSHESNKVICNNKVIQFPNKIKAEEQEPVLNQEPTNQQSTLPPALKFEKHGFRDEVFKKQHKFRFDREQRKILVSASLVAVLFGVTMANRFLLNNEPILTHLETFQSHSPSRSIASIQPMIGDTRNTEWEQKLANKLNQEGIRVPASIGTAPTVEEELQFGFLEGKYAVKMNQGKIEHLRFVALSERPKYLKKPSGFLVQYMELMPAQFEEARLIQREEDGRLVRETYSLDTGSDSVGKVAIEMDQQGRLLTLAVIQDAEKTLDVRSPSSN